MAGGGWWHLRGIPTPIRPAKPAKDMSQYERGRLCDARENCKVERASFTLASWRDTYRDRDRRPLRVPRAIAARESSLTL